MKSLISGDPALPGATLAATPSWHCGANARRLAASTGLVIVAGLATAAAASASTTFVVDDPADAPLAEPSGTRCQSTFQGDCTLRAAVQAADNLGGATSIELRKGEYNLEIPSTSANEPANGDLDVNGAETSITIEGKGAAVTTINANHLDRAFTVQSGEQLTVGGVTVRNGAQPGTGAGEDSTEPGAGGAFLNLGYLAVEDCTLTGNTAANGAVIAAGSSATLTKIENCTVEHNASHGEGGVVKADAGTVEFDRDTIGFNTADSYGGVLSYQPSGIAGSVEIEETAMYRNVAGNEGGALYLYGAVYTEIGLSELYENSSYDSYGGAIADEHSGPLYVDRTFMGYNSSGDADGGAVYADATSGVEVRGSTIVDNSAGSDAGGGLYAYEANITVEEGVFGGNEAGDGGAIYVDGTASAADQTIRNMAFRENEATNSKGGAIYDARGALSVQQSTFSGNSANESGGAVYYGSQDRFELVSDTFDGNLAADNGGAIAFYSAPIEGEAILLNDTIANNVAYDGGGISNPEDSDTIENTIVADNVGGSTSDGGGDCYGDFATDNAGESDAGGNIDSDGTCFSGSIEHDHVGVDPRLFELEPNGGMTETMALRSNSPAIGNAVSTAWECPIGDQREINRVGPCDSGAYQRVPVTTSITEEAPATVAVGENVTYKLQVHNDGPGSAHEVQFTDPLPAGTSYEGESSSRGSSCSGTSTVTCHLGSLSQGETEDIEITVDAVREGSLTNTATVAAEEQTEYPQLDQASATTDVGPQTTTTTTTSTTEATQPTQTVEVVKTVSTVQTVQVSTVQTVEVPVEVSGSVSAPAAQCKSDRSEKIDWRVSSGIRLTDVLVTVNGKTVQTLPGSARTATVSMAGMPKGRVVVRVVGLTHSRGAYAMTRVYHLCVPHRTSPRAPSDYLTLQ